MQAIVDSVRQYLKDSGIKLADEKANELASMITS